MIAYLQVLITFAVVLQLLSQGVPLPENAVREIVIQTIDECDVLQLTGMHTRRQTSSDSNSVKRTRIKYDYH